MHPPPDSGSSNVSWKNALHERRYVAAFAVVAAFVLIAALVHFRAGPPSQSASRERITISTARYPLSALIFIARRKGYFTREGVDVTLRETAAGKLSIQEVLAGQADLGGAADTAVMYSIASRRPLSIIATVGESSGENTVIGRKDRGVLKLSDLRGKKLGLSKGTSSQYYVDRLLVDLGIAEREVEIVDTSPAQIVDALQQGKVDAIVTWNPYLAQAEERLGRNASVLTRDGLAKVTWALFGSPEYVRSHPAAVKAVLRALVRAESDLFHAPDEARLMLARELGMNPDWLARAWPTYHFEVALDQSLIVALEEQSRWAISKRLVPIGATPNFLVAIDSTYLLDVRPETVQLVR